MPVTLGAQLADSGFSKADTVRLREFLERDLAFGESVGLAVWDLGLLMLFNLVFFAGAWISFTRYDVR